MRKLLALGVLAIVVAAAGLALAQPPTVEVLCLTTPTRVPRSATSKGWQLYNHGPNAIVYERGSNGADGGPPVYTDGGTIVDTDVMTPIVPGEKQSADDPSSIPLWCIAKTASQVHDAATILQEAF